MTSKDWILLVIPIISSILFQGILLFLFQKKMSLYFDYQNKKMSEDYNIQQQFRNLVLATYNNTQILSGLAKKLDNLEFNGFIEFDKSMIELINYYRLYDLFLKKFKKNINNLIKMKLVFNSLLEQILEPMIDEMNLNDTDLGDAKPNNTIMSSETTSNLTLSSEKLGESEEPDRRPSSNIDIRIVYQAIDMILRKNDLGCDERKELESLSRELKHKMILASKLQKNTNNIKSELAIIIKKL